MLVGDINPGPGDSTPYEFADVGGTLFICADDGAHGGELWMVPKGLITPMGVEFPAKHPAWERPSCLK